MSAIAPDAAHSFGYNEVAPAHATARGLANTSEEGEDVHQCTDGARVAPAWPSSEAA